MSASLPQQLGELRRRVVLGQRREHRAACADDDVEFGPRCRLPGIVAFPFGERRMQHRDAFAGTAKGKQE